MDLKLHAEYLALPTNDTQLHKSKCSREGEMHWCINQYMNRSAEMGEDLTVADQREENGKGTDLIIADECKMNNFTCTSTRNNWLRLMNREAELVEELSYNSN